VNIGYMDVDRKSRLGDALTVIETDDAIPESLTDSIRRLNEVTRVACIDFTAKGVV
jgi:L-serine dehydratase